MGKKKLIVTGIGLVILIIAVGIAYQNYAYAKLARKQVDALNTIIQQKDIQITKLTEEIKAKQDELSGIRAGLDNANKALNDAKTPINKDIQQPTIPVPQTVNK